MSKNKTNIDHTNIKITAWLVIVLLILVIVSIKLFSIQVVDSSRYKLAAKKQYESKISLNPLRGIIFDRKLNPLVSNVDMFSFAADPNMIDDKDSIASFFAHIFSKDKEFYLEKLEQENTSFVWLERRVDPEFDSVLKNIDFSGVIKINESHRVFNYDKTASQLIGATNIDNDGISGIEYQFNKELGGEDGFVIMQKDGLGRKRPSVEYPRNEPKNGNNIVLTIDLNIQQAVEEELSNAVYMNNAAGGRSVVMNVRTGEILGIYSLYKDNSNDDYSSDKLAAVTDQFEPGSTFKLVAAAGALEENIENKTSIIQTQGGEYTVFGNKKITDSHKSSFMSFRQVIEQSSNVGMIQIVNKLGEDKFFKYARNFGFGVTTGIELPGEAKGILKRPAEFSPVSLKYMAIGYEVMVNAVQITNAYSSIANDGILMKPYILKQILNPDGSLFKDNRSQIIRSVCSKETANTLTDLLYGVVEKGTGVDAKIENIKIAGKTGTSQKLVDGEYSKQNYTSSFIGYFPAEDPIIAVSVIIDSPSAGEYFGGKVAAPVFKKITERLLSLNCLIEYKSSTPPVMTGSELNIAVHNKMINLVDMNAVDAVSLLNEQNIDFEVKGEIENCIVKEQEMDNSGKIYLITADRLRINNDNRMPDLMGMSLRKAISVLSSGGMDFTVKGNGKVLEQYPAPGTLLNNKVKVNLVCDPGYIEF